MNKKTLYIIIFSVISLLYIAGTAFMDIYLDEGIFSGHWWWGGGLIALGIGFLVWGIRFMFKNLKKEPEKEKPKEEEKKDDFFVYQQVLDSYDKDIRNKDPDMHKVKTLISFPSIEKEKVKIIETEGGYNDPSHNVLLAVDSKSKKVIAVSTDGDLEKFKLNLKPKLESITESTEEDALSGKKRKVTVTTPMVERELRQQLKEAQEKKVEEEKIETMDSSKKEEKK